MFKYDQTLPTGLTYARSAKVHGFTDVGFPVGGSTDWNNLVIFDLKTKEFIPDVIEVNSAEGWLKYHVKDRRGKFIMEREEGDTRRDLTVKVGERTGRFEIRQKPVEVR